MIREGAEVGVSGEDGVLCSFELEEGSNGGRSSWNRASREWGGFIIRGKLV
ncbi:hypothetical protein LguiA_006875 [Lonicera macranthoides]